MTVLASESRSTSDPPTILPRAGAGRLELSGVHLSYFSAKQETPALQDVSFSVEPGEFIAIVGPSGCGKSTFLSLIAGLIQPTAGRVTVDGIDVKGPSRRIGYMLQHDHLFEWRTVLNNVMLGAEIQGLDKGEARERALTLLNRYGLGGFENHYPEEMSGGMRQRVALIRTLLTRPDILLLDEPFSALDFQTRLALADEMADILQDRETGEKTVVLVTHDISEAISMATRVLVLTGRPGRIKAEHAFGLHGQDRRRRPFEVRALPEFNACFDVIWGELDVDVAR